MPDRPARPNIFVVGDAKCGTTSLYRLLQLTPGIGTSTTRKELHFFSEPEIMAGIAGPGDDAIPSAIIHDEASYLAEFAGLPPDLANVVDVSPSYLQNPPAATRIHAFAPAARIVILLREPAAKVFSQYVHLWAEGREALPFEAAFEKSAERRGSGFSTMFDYEAGGYYADAVARYFDLFGEDRVRVFLFEELFGPDDGPRQRLAAFLGVSFPDGPLPRVNIGGRVRSPVLGALLRNDALRDGVTRLLPLALRTRISRSILNSVEIEKPDLDPAMRTALRRRYAGDVARLEVMLGRRTGWPAA
jgi:Sulfotransferase family